MARGTFLVATAAACAALLAAASGTARWIREGGTLRVVEASGRFTSIDPALATSFTEGQILRPACAGLVSFPNGRLPAGLRLEPELAEALPVVTNGARTYTFTIRKDARFSDGKPVTALDFVHSLERVLDPETKSPFGPLFGDIVVGAEAMLSGKATSVAGATARGRKLTLKLTRPVPDFPVLLAGPPATLCVVPRNVGPDPEGARAPLPSAAPYYVAQYVPGERVVLQRNRFYRGERPHHLAQIVADLGADAGTALDQVTTGRSDYALGPPSLLSERAALFAKRYGVNKSQFFVIPSPGVRMFALNTSRPLFRNNLSLRQALNFAVDRRALARELGPHAGAASDQFLPPTMPGYRDGRIYPLTGPDLRKARSLASGRTRSGKAVLYTTSFPVDIAQAEILRRNLDAIGIDLDVKSFPFEILFDKLATPGEPFDIGRISFSGLSDPGFLNFLFDGRTIGTPGSGNWSYLNSARFNGLLDEASRLSGPPRYRAYGELDVRLARDAAPAIPYGIPNALTFVSSRVGCVVLNPELDLTAVCLK